MALTSGIGVPRRDRAAALAARLAAGLLLAIALAVPCASSAVAEGGGRTPWVAPLDGRPVVVHGFSPPGMRWESGHRGVDLSGSEGQVVRAAGSGRVTYAGSLAGRGVVVVTHPDGTRTTYEPVRAAVTVGDAVTAGAVIGRLAGVGHCLPAACLHWGRLRGLTYLDPMALLGSRAVRLLPVWGSGAGASRQSGLGSTPDSGAAAGPAVGRRDTRLDVDLAAATPARTAAGVLGVGVAATLLRGRRPSGRGWADRRPAQRNRGSASASRR